MAKKVKPVKKEVLVVKGKVYKRVKGEGLRLGGDFIPALSEKVDAIITASIQKIQADGKKKTLNAVDLA